MSLKITEVAIKRINKYAEIVVTAEHTPGIKLGDFFTTDDKYYPLKVVEITEKYDVLEPKGHWRAMAFDKDKNSLEEISVIKTYKYRIATPEEKKELDEDSCLL